MAADLEGRVRAVLGRGHDVVGAAVVVEGGVTTASWGAPPDADFEIGSVSKGVTGLLYADALGRGEVRPTTTLGELLPLGEAPAAGVTLASLATHRSGLPRLPFTADLLRRQWELWRHGRNPYRETLDDLVETAREVPVGKPAPVYSNLGFELLGHALAGAAGTTYGELVTGRVAHPVGIEVLYAPASAGQLGPGALVGRSRGGRTREPWAGEAVGPAGGLRSTVADMARLIAALLDGTAPGLTALDPVADLGRGARVGAAWVTIDDSGREITWHNGGTGGFRSWVGMDRAAGRGVVLLTATSRSVDAAGFRLLRETART